jgi:hypothetical protein
LLSIKMDWIPCLLLLLCVSLCVDAVCSTCMCSYVLMLCAVHRYSTHKLFSCADPVCSTQGEDKCAVRTTACAGCTCCSIGLCAAMCWWQRLTSLQDNAMCCCVLI